MALLHQVSQLGHKKFLVKLVSKDALARTYKWETELNTDTPIPGPAPGTQKVQYLVKLVAKDALARTYQWETKLNTGIFTPGRKSIWSNLWQKFEDRNIKVREREAKKVEKEVEKYTEELRKF